MPNWVSKDGTWYPAKEKAALVDHKTGEPYIYDGADRAALFELWQQKVETLGQDFHNDPELIMRVRQLGYKDVEEYAKVMGWDKEKVEEDFKKKAEVVTLHELPKKVKPIKTLGGGKDFAGQGDDIYGGFDKRGVTKEE